MRKLEHICFLSPHPPLLGLLGQCPNFHRFFYFDGFPYWIRTWFDLIFILSYNAVILGLLFIFICWCNIAWIIFFVIMELHFPFVYIFVGVCLLLIIIYWCNIKGIIFGIYNFPVIYKRSILRPGSFMYYPMWILRPSSV